MMKRLIIVVLLVISWP
ncbi:type I toxin-antitoxin system Ibs family toxin, partial [Escherichia coli]|nr:type I toxin-antitoxin system Ibs family toxin [Escherichia coli]